MNSKAKGLFAICVFVLGALFPIMADGADISVDAVDVTPGSGFTVGIQMTNNSDALSALVVPLKFNSTFLNIDSVSFAGSILPATFKGNAVIDNIKHTVKISYIANQFSSPIPTFNTLAGLLATIHFSISAGAPVGNIPLDSVYRDSVVSLGGNTIHYWNRLESSNQSGTEQYLPTFQAGGVNVMLSTDIGDDSNSLLPDKFQLAQNYPNPFNPTTTIEYSLAKAGQVSLKIYNVIGQEVAALFDGHKSAGVYSIEFDAENFPSGVYFYKLIHQDGAETRKMLLVK